MGLVVREHTRGFRPSEVGCRPSRLGNDREIPVAFRRKLGGKPDETFLSGCWTPSPPCSTKNLKPRVYNFFGPSIFDTEEVFPSSYPEIVHVLPPVLESRDPVEGPVGRDVFLPVVLL